LHCRGDNYQNILEILQNTYLIVLNTLVLRRECYIHDIKFQFRKIILTAELKTFNPLHFFAEVGKIMGKLISWIENNTIGFTSEATTAHFSLELLNFFLHISFAY
jgi:hypothetical protein